MTTRDIQGHLKELYGVEVSPDLISTVTDSVMQEVAEWQSRPLAEVYPILYLDATIVKVRSEGRVINKSAYLAVGITRDGNKDVLGIWLEQTEGAKFWLKVMTELKNRGERHLYRLCGRIKRIPGGHRGYLSPCRGPVMYCTHGAQFPAVYPLEGAQAGGCRFEDDLSCDN